MAKKRPTKKKKPATRKPSSRQLDKLDREILALINARTELTAKRDGESRAGQMAEDAAALERAIAQNKGPLDDDSIKAIFREVYSGSHSVAHPIRAAYLGPEFTYSHLAAIQRFGQSVELVPVGTIASVFEEVERGHAEYGIVPIENSTDGRVADALECLAHSSVKICGEIPLGIHHCLLGKGGRSDIKRIYSKAQPLSQCRYWLSKHMPDAQLSEVASTGEAARLAAQQPKSAAIASEQSAVNHGLSVLARKIEDNPDNVTRFAVIGAESGARTGKDKTSLVFEISHRPGALADAMGIFKRHRLNMTWIESFPVRGKRGTYLFFIEFQGHASELRARRALASLEKKASRLTVLGSYAQTESIG
jgi:chorismate mutase/prephenate dehydratase